GIAYETSSESEDLHGVDFFVILPSGEKLKVDIKYRDRQVQNIVHTGGYLPNYNLIGDNRVILYTGARRALGKELLQLEKEDVEQYGAQLAKMLLEIDQTIAIPRRDEINS